MGDGLRVAFLGNHSVSYSSESHEAASFEALGHTVTRIQEGEIPALAIPSLVKGHDLFFHVQTRGLAITGGNDDERKWMLDEIRAMSIPSVGYHLDLFFGLDRAEYVRSDPYFQVDHFFSPDGGHDNDWKDAGVNHFWLPPAVYHAEAYDALPNPRRWPGKVAFVGSWRGYAHAEHAPVREAMLSAMRRRFGRQFVCHPQRGAIRGADLNELYATIPVIIGDSCLAGKVHGYWSDRVPETLGRGGFLIHPYVPGILNVHPDLVTYKAENWDKLIERVEHYLDNPTARESNRKSNADWVRRYNTYLNRMGIVIDTVFGKGEKVAAMDTSQVTE